MKQQIKRLAAVLGLVSLVALAGCGGSSTSSTSTTSGSTTSVSGVVADGYLGWAKVCLDKNNNKKCDSDEPTTVTAPNGSYTLNNVLPTDIATYPILVEVTTSATDEQRGAVKVGYVLTAPAGKTAFISPLTTLIQHQVETNHVSADVAEASVRTSLGLSASTSLFADFKPGATAATADEKLAASVAMVIADTIAINKQALQAADSSVTIQSVVSQVMQKVADNLATFKLQVSNNLGSDGTLSSANIAAVIQNSNLAIATSGSSVLAGTYTGTVSDGPSFSITVASNGLLSGTDGQGAPLSGLVNMSTGAYTATVGAVEANGYISLTLTGTVNTSTGTGTYAFVYNGQTYTGTITKVIGG